MKGYEKIQILPYSFGTYKVITTYRGKQIDYLCNDMELIDLFKSKERGYKKAGNILHYRAVESYKYLNF